MAFRKRNIAVQTGVPAVSDTQESETRSGIRPSPSGPLSVTSTGTASLDDLLGGHSGLVLGSSVLVEEHGTTDYAGALLKYFAAEGLCHGHMLHVVGMGPDWTRDLPGVVERRPERSGSAATSQSVTPDADKMKIAWRYERLGQAGERVSLSSSNIPASHGSTKPFCHTFDLSKRLIVPNDAKVNYISISPSQPFDTILRSLAKNISTSTQHFHRLVIPSLLSPALYPPQSSQPSAVMNFMRGLRALLRQHPSRVVMMATLPLGLYPRSLSLVRWLETLCDGVLELTPFPHMSDISESAGSISTADEAHQQPQGTLRVHKLPLNTERGEGGAGAGNSLGEDLAFTVSRRKFVIKAFSLPPVEGDQEAQEARADHGGTSKKDVDF